MVLLALNHKPFRLSHVDPFFPAGRFGFDVFEPIGGVGRGGSGGGWTLVLSCAPGAETGVRSDPDFRLVDGPGKRREVLFSVSGNLRTIGGDFGHR